MIQNNFGLNGQSHDPWENFLCLSKKCRNRKDEKRKLRNEKKELKNDERRAEIERLRSETELVKDASPWQGASIPPMRPTPRTVPPPQEQGTSANRTDTPASTTEGSNTWLYVGIFGGILVLGVGGYFVYRKYAGKKLAASSKKIAA